MFNKLIEKLYLRQKNNLAYYDDLTKCYNRNYFNMVVLPKIKHGNYCVAMLDMDNFKEINDSRGHYIGDQFLIQLASELKEFGLVCRVGGDEFTILLENDKIAAFKEYCLKHEKLFSYSLKFKTDGEDVLHFGLTLDKELYRNKNYKKSHNKDNQ